MTDNHEKKSVFGTQQNGESTRMKSNMIVYTAVFGDYSLPFAQPRYLKNKLYCFTENKSGQHNGWKLIDVNHIKDFPKETTQPNLKNRFCKINPHILFPYNNQSIYIDSNFIVKTNIESLVQDRLSQKNLWAFDHAQTMQDPRDCIYEEAKAIQEIFLKEGKKKDDLSKIEQQVSFLKEQGYPCDNGLIKGGVLLRNHLEKDIIKLMECWWKMVSTMSSRDQLSFNYCAWKNKIDFGYLKGDIRKGNPYFRMNGSHSSSRLKRSIIAKFNQLKNL